MRFSFNTINHSVMFGLPPTLPEQIAAAAAAGYDDVGLDLASVLAHEAAGLSPAELGALIRDHGLGCYELAVLRLTTDPEAAADALDTVLRVVDGLRPEVVYAITYDSGGDALAAPARQAADALRARGVGMAIEFVAGFGVATVAEARALAEAAGPDVGVVVDAWQLSRTGGTPADVEGLGLERLGFLQVSDAAAEPGGPLAVEMSNGRLLPGEGAGDAAAICRAGRAIGYDGHISVEVLSAAWRARPVAELAAASLAASHRVWEDALSAPAP